MSILTQTHILRLKPREAVIDAVLRFANGLDEGDRLVVEFAFTDNVTFDLTPLSSIGVPYGVTTGKSAVVDQLMKCVGEGMDSRTTSQISECTSMIVERKQTSQRAPSRNTIAREKVLS